MCCNMPAYISEYVALCVNLATYELVWMSHVAGICMSGIVCAYMNIYVCICIYICMNIYL